MKIGVAYYPEQWPPSRWESDARTMAQFGADVVRIGEFAWSRLEPRRERIETDWLEDAITVLAGHGMQVILCTPTAAPPPWLFNRHKSILPMRPNGTQFYYGSRRHVCLNNPAYLKYVRRIVTELARRFGNNSNIFAWQIDNELSLGDTGTCYCDECEQAFRMWLKRRYGTIDRLNKLWGTAFWSQEFVDWHEVPAPRETAEAPHPSLLLDYRRFTSAQARSFVKRQKDIINECSQREAPVTVNEPCATALPHINAFSIAELQDIVSLNNYPSHVSRLPETVMGLDFARSLQGGPFWVIEQQAGAASAGGAPGQPNPGQLRLWAYQAAARGAELICFFRWRTAVAGQQMHEYGILDPDGVPRRRYDELKRTVAEIKEKHSAWEGQLPLSRAAICVDFDSAWALQSTQMGSDPDYFTQVAQFHDSLRRRGLTADFVSGRSDLDGYELVVVPMPLIATSGMAKQLEIYVRRGGTLLVTAPAGHVSGSNTTGDIRPPGTLSSLLGVEIKEYDNPAESNEVVFEDTDAGSFSASGICCILELRGARSLAGYKRGYYSGTPALTASEAEGGRAIFLGTTLSRSGIDKVVGQALEAAGVEPVEWTAEENVEVVELRANAGGARKLFLLNHCARSQVVDFAGMSGRELLSETPVQGRIELAPYQTVLVELSEEKQE